MITYFNDFFHDSFIVYDDKTKNYILDNKKNSDNVYIISLFVGYDKKYNAFFVPVVDVEKKIYKQIYVLPRYIKKIRLQNKKIYYLIKINKNYFKLYALCMLFDKSINKNLLSGFDKITENFKSLKFKIIKFDDKIKVDNLIVEKYKHNSTKSGYSAVGGGGVV